MVSLFSFMLFILISILFIKLSLYVHCQNGFSFGFSLGLSFGFMAYILFVSNACCAPQPKCLGKMMQYFNEQDTINK